MAFESIVANAKRSWQIHTYPRAGRAKLYLNGLCLTDFGANYKGYHSDVTIPFVIGKLNDQQEKIVKTVIKSYEAAIETIDIN